MNKTIEYYNLQKLIIKDNAVFFGGYFYGKNREDAEKNLKDSHTGDDPMYCLMYKSTVIYDSENNDYMNNIVNDIQTIGTAINNIIEKGDRIKSSNNYTFNGNKYHIEQNVNILEKNNEGKATMINPVYIKYKKNNKIYLYRPSKNIKLEVKETDKSKKLNAYQDAYQKKVDYMKKQINISRNHFGVFLLEEHVKDEFKNIKANIELAKKQKELNEAINKLKALQKQTNIEQKNQQDNFKSSVLTAGTKRLEDFVDMEMKLTGMQINYDAQKKDINDGNSEEKNAELNKLKTSFEEKKLSIGVELLEKEINIKLKDIVSYQSEGKANAKIDELQKKIEGDSDVRISIIDNHNKELLEIGTKRLQELISYKMNIIGKDLEFKQKMIDNATADKNTIKEKYEKEKTELGIKQIKNEVTRTLGTIVPLEMKLKEAEKNQITDVYDNVQEVFVDTTLNENINDESKNIGNGIRFIELFVMNEMKNIPKQIELHKAKKELEKFKDFNLVTYEEYESLQDLGLAF